jgi:hypothetical protein
MFRLITIDFSQKSPHFSLLSPTSPCELSERSSIDRNIWSYLICELWFYVTEMRKNKSKVCFVESSFGQKVWSTFPIAEVALWRLTSLSSWSKAKFKSPCNFEEVPYVAARVFSPLVIYENVDIKWEKINQKFVLLKVASDKKFGQHFP